MRLITIPMSHYCEKARWALERLGLEYYEERHLQVFHYPRTWWISRGPSVPVLVDGGRVVADSTAILQHLDNSLVGELTGVSVLHGPAALVSRDDAGLQYMIAVIPRVGEPVG